MGDLHSKRYKDLASAITAFCFASVGMIVLNKIAVQAMQLATTLVIMQSLGTLFFLGAIPKVRREVQPLEKEKVKKWLPVALLFTLMVLSSLKALLYVSVSTMLIFRNIANVVTTVAEYYVLGKRVNIKIVTTLTIIILGTFLYGQYNASWDFWGYLWMTTNISSQVAYNIYVKYLMEKGKIGDMTRYGMSFYNTILSLPGLLLLGFLLGEFHNLSSLNGVSVVGWIVIFISCVVGFFISTTGFHLQHLVSATTYMVINNLNKIAAILFGMVFLGDEFHGAVAVFGCVLALGAGMWYSYERWKILEEERRERTIQVATDRNLVLDVMVDEDTKLRET